MLALGRVTAGDRKNDGAESLKGGLRNQNFMGHLLAIYMSDFRGKLSLPLNGTKHIPILWKVGKMTFSPFAPNNLSHDASMVAW